MSAQYAKMQHRARLRRQPIPRELWLAGDGLVHAQQPVCANPRLIRTLLGLGALGTLAAAAYLAWVIHSLLWPTATTTFSTSPPRWA